MRGGWQGKARYRRPRSPAAESNCQTRFVCRWEGQAPNSRLRSPLRLVRRDELDRKGRIQSARLTRPTVFILIVPPSSLGRWVGDAGTRRASLFLADWGAEWANHHFCREQCTREVAGSGVSLRTGRSETVFRSGTVLLGAAWAQGWEGEPPDAPASEPNAEMRRDLPERRRSG